jgi:hypothetical protein
MKKYMAYSRIAGSSDGAVLVFAYSAREAKKVFWQFDGQKYGDGICEEYTEIGINLIKDKPWLDKEATLDVPHCVYPKGCNRCETWGVSEIGTDGLCDICREEKNES